MFWRKREQEALRPSGIEAKVYEEAGITIIDVRGQTCPGYLLAINKAVSRLATEQEVQLLTTYAPCGEDVKAWCRERGLSYLNSHRQDDMWIIQIRT